jgi:NADH dehydrogenase
MADPWTQLLAVLSWIVRSWRRPAGAGAAWQQAARRIGRADEGMGRHPALARSTRPMVVVVGAGFAGMAVVRNLAKAPVDVTLIDRHDYKLFTPLLYQVASAVLAPSEIVRPLRSMLSGRRIDVRLATATSLDLDRRVVITDRGEVPYDILVAATGSVTSFPSKTIEQRSLALKDLDDAVTLRSRVLEQFEAARWEPDEKRRRQLLAFVIVGGGPTGVEFAGSLNDLVQLILDRESTGLDREVSVTIIEGEGSLLRTFGPKLGKQAERALVGKGILVIQGRVQAVTAARVKLADGSEVRSGLTVWAAGVRASDLASALTDKPGKGGTVPVDRSLRLTSHPEVFVLGDLAAVGEGDKLLPMLAAVAQQEGEYSARSITALAMGAPDLPSFRYRDRGMMATNGRFAAVVKAGPYQLHGLPGWLAWLVVHIALLTGFRNRGLVILSWLSAFVFQNRAVRLIGPSVRKPRGG